MIQLHNSWIANENTCRRSSLTREGWSLDAWAVLIQPTCDCFFFGFYHPFYFLKKHPVDHVHIYTYIHTVHYIALHYITLHYVTLHYIPYIHNYITLHYIPYHTILTLHYIALHCITHIYIIHICILGIVIHALGIPFWTHPLSLWKPCRYCQRPMLGARCNPVVASTWWMKPWAKMGGIQLELVNLVPLVNIKIAGIYGCSSP